MTGLLVFKDKLKFFYGKYDRYITMLIKFLLGFLAFTMLNQNIGFMTKLKNPLVPLLLGLVCSWLPYGAITFLAAVFMLTHLYAISLEMTLIALAFMLIIGILYYGFQPGDSFLLLVTPILFWFKIPYMVPLLVGLSGGLTCVIPVSTGVFLYYA
ncbi:MAG: ABC transporter permease, partial [Hungatella sp.]